MRLLNTVLRWTAGILSGWASAVDPARRSEDPHAEALGEVILVPEEHPYG